MNIILYINLWRFSVRKFSLHSDVLQMHQINLRCLKTLDLLCAMLLGWGCENNIVFRRWSSNLYVRLDAHGTARIHMHRGTLQLSNKNRPTFDFSIIPTCVLGAWTQNVGFVQLAVLQKIQILHEETFHLQTPRKGQVAVIQVCQKVVQGAKVMPKCLHDPCLFHVALWFFCRDRQKLAHVTARAPGHAGMAGPDSRSQAATQQTRAAPTFPC